MPENIELPGASHNKTNQVERAVDTPADFTSPEELYKDLIAAIKKYHPSTDLSDIEKAYETARKAHEGEYEPGNYLPISEKSIDGMYEELLKYVHSIKNSYLNKLLVKFFEEDEEFIKTFKGNSAASDRSTT